MLAGNMPETVANKLNRRGKIRHHQNIISLLQKCADIVLIACTLWLVCDLFGIAWSRSVAVAGLLAAVLFYFFAEKKDLYRSWRTATKRKEARHTLEAWLGVVVSFTVTAYFIGFVDLHHREAMLLWFLLVPVNLIVWRLGVRHALRVARAHGINTRKVAIAGSGELAHRIREAIDESRWTGLRVIGIFDDDEQGKRRGENGQDDQGIKGGLESLVAVARDGGVDVVYIALSREQEGSRIEKLVGKLSDSTVSVYLVQDRRSGDRRSGANLPDLSLFNVLHCHWVSFDGIPAVSVYESPFLGLGGWIKRVEDVVISIAALMILAIPMVVIAVGVKLSSPGPALFKQRRYGLDGRKILVWKFRSMTVCEDGDEIRQARKTDPRVTPFGAFLRRTSLDELPQFINVLQGSMSIVGPRPHAVAHNEYYREIIGGYMLRHKVKPGITGWAQVNGWRGETDSVDKMRMRVDFDLAYIRNWSLWLDIRIILMTPIHGFIHKNAY